MLKFGDLGRKVSVHGSAPDSDLYDLSETINIAKGAYMPEPKAGETFVPGKEVPRSGVYRVVHCRRHTPNHEVTCVFGKTFPPCNYCDNNVRFVLLRGARHIVHNKFFKVRLIPSEPAARMGTAWTVS